MCHGGSTPATTMPAAKPKPRAKVKPAPKAKTAQQEATKADLLFQCHGHIQPNKYTNLCVTKPCQVMKDASTAILECKSWKSKLEAAGTQEPQYVCCIFFKYLMQ